MREGAEYSKISLFFMQISLLGKKFFAYPLKKQTQGVYVLAKLKGTHARVSEIEKKVQLGTDVLRFLLTSVN